MIDVYQHKGIAVRLGKSGASQYTKASYPLKYGVFSEIETEEAILQFNLNQ